MSKTNRGKTSKVSIRLTDKAKERIEKVAANLNLSKSGVILFALARIIDNFPDKQTVLNMESKYSLEEDFLTVTANIELANKMDDIRKEYNIKKYELYGWVISDYFETQLSDELLQDRKKKEPKNVLIYMNKELKEKLDDYSEKNYIPLSGLVSYSVLNGGADVFPQYSNAERETVTTRIPLYISDEVKKESAKLGISESFYFELCLYKMLSDPVE